MPEIPGASKPAGPEPTVVDDPSQLTAEWMTAALRYAGHKVTVRSVEVEPIGTGQMGSSFRLTIDVDGSDVGEASELPTTLVAKLPTADLEARVAIASSHRTEVSFYRDLAPTIAAKVPRCELALISDDSTRFTLLLEDLAPAQQGDQLAGCTADQLVAAARNLAGLHGPRWCDPTLADHRGPLDPVDEATAAFLGEVMAGAVGPFAERLGAAITAEDAALLAECAAATPAFLMGRPDRFALLHGDYRLDNLMFHPDGSVAAVDWQTVGVGLPGRDLAYLIATSMEPEDRRAIERVAVESYRERLVEFLADRPADLIADPETVFDDFRFGLLQGPLIIVIGATFGRSTPRGDAMFATMTARVCAALRDHDTLSMFG
jgi:hypothetical protein